MEESQSIRKEKTDEVDYDSFLRQEENQQSFQEGTAQLIRHVKSDEAKILGYSDDSEVFEVEKAVTDEKGYLVVEDSDWDIIEAWTGSSDLQDLAGSFVPVYKKSKELYQVHQFEDIRSALDLSYSDLKYLYDNNCIEYEDGQWVMTDVWEEHNTFLSKTQSIMSFIGFVSAIASMVFLMTNTSVFMYIFLLGVWMTTLGIQMYLSTKKHKPIKTVIDNIN